MENADEIVVYLTITNFIIFSDLNSLSFNFRNLKTKFELHVKMSEVSQCQV